MRYQISGKQIDIGAALQTHVQTELGEVVGKYAQRPTDANVVFSRSAHEYVCELCEGRALQADGGDPVRVLPEMLASQVLHESTVWLPTGAGSLLCRGSCVLL